MRIGLRTLSGGECTALLRVTSRHLRDHLLVSLGLETGLRLDEIVALNVGDVYSQAGRARTRLTIRSGRPRRSGTIFLPGRLVFAVSRFLASKRRKGEGVRPESPLFCSQSGARLEAKAIGSLFRDWQLRAGFERAHPFQILRQTAIARIYHVSGDLLVAQRFARHATPLVTAAYLLSDTTGLDPRALEGRWEAEERPSGLMRLMEKVSLPVSAGPLLERRGPKSAGPRRRRVSRPKARQRPAG